MGNTTVKGLSESTGQSVENVIEMLSEAGIQVSTAEDELSQEQIMQFLDYKSKSAASSGRISLKAGAAKKTSASAGAKVAIKNRKKTLSLSSNASADTAPTSSDATSELTKQMESEARVRVEAEQQKREQEQAKQAAKQSAEQEAAAETAAPAESETSAAAETPAETPAPAPRVDLSPAEMAAQAKKEEGVGIKRRPSRKPTVTTTPSNDSVKVSKKGGKKVFEGRPQQENYGASGRRIKRKDKRKVNVEVSSDHQFEKPVAPVQKEITVPEMVVVSDLAKKLAVKGGDVLKAMMNMGMMATINQSIDQDTAILVVEEMGHKAEPEKTAAEEEDEAIALGDLEQFELKHRPPVVTIMGHVDHGKTSLLDYIRATRVAAGEAGGITQHIGAYHVETDDGIISFLDTPGHAAFSQMRSRGASSTDIVVIVVAADDGVMPQTIEAIKHTRAANVPLIVAVNKIDKEGADPERVKTAMTQHEVVPDDWGGEDVFVNLSAKTGEGVDSLLENILLIAEVQELKARDEGPAKGSIIESSIEKGRGAVATVLVQEGTLNKGDVVLAGNEYGKVRALLDENRKPTDSAGPSIPVEILGLSGTPSAGDELVVIESERLARELADKRKVSEREVEFTTQQAAKLEAMINKMSNADVQTINLMLKTDVHGSMEAIRTAIMDLSNAEIEVNIVLKGVGGISETDITLAQASQAVVLAFNVRADATARRLASESGVEIRYYSIIYELLDDIKDAMSGMLAPELREEMVGMAEVKAVYKGTGFGEIAGCMVTEGTVRRSLPIRVLRDNVVVYEGELESLRRFKDDVQEVKSGTECGIGVKDYDVRVGDQIEVFQRTEIERTMDDIRAED